MRVATAAPTVKLRRSGARAPASVGGSTAIERPAGPVTETANAAAETVAGLVSGLTDAVEASPAAEGVRRSWLAESVRRARRAHLGVHATALAAQLLTTLIPLTLVLVALLRRTTESGAVYGAGPTGRWVHAVFDPAASTDLARVFASTRHVAGATTVGSLGLLVISVIGVPASFQRIAELVWDLPEAPTARAVVRQVLWIVTLVPFIALLSVLDTLLLTARVQVFGVLVVNSVLVVPYLLVTQHLVLGARIRWRQLLLGSVFAAIGLLGLFAAAAGAASATITGTVDQFGSIGVAFALQGLVLAVAYVVTVAVLLGAVLTRRRRPDLRKTPPDPARQDSGPLSGGARRRRRD